MISGTIDFPALNNSCQKPVRKIIKCRNLLRLLRIIPPPLSLPREGVLPKRTVEP